MFVDRSFVAAVIELTRAAASDMFAIDRGIDLSSRKGDSRSFWLMAFLLTKSVALAE
jgi:hypothetical protein